MKKYSNILLAVLALAATVSCKKENDRIIPENNGKVTILTAHVDNDIESKTTLDGVNVVWSTDDVITAFDAAGKCYNSTETEILEDGAVAKFSVPVQEPLYAAYPAYEEGSEIEMTGGKITATIPVRQDAVDGSFNNNMNVEVAKITDKDNIHFKNVGGLLAVKVKGTTRKIASIRIADAAGVFKMTGSVTVGFDESGNVKVDDIDSGESYVDLTGDITAGETYYAVVAPGIYEGVTITFTDEDGNTATYTKKSDLDVERNSNQLLGGFDIPESKWESGEKYYVKVVSDKDLLNGTYLIVYETGNVAFNGGLNKLDATSNTINVDITDNKIKSDKNTDAASFLIKDGTIKSASGYYIGVSSYKNGLVQSDETSYENAISIDEDGNALISITFEGGEMKLRYNKTSGQTRFRYFTSNQESIALYLLEGTGTAPKANPGLAFAESSYVFSLGDDNYAAFSGQALTNQNNLTVTWESSNTELATVDNGIVTFVENAIGETIITASFEGDETYKSGSASYTIKVKAVAGSAGTEENPYTASEARAAAIALNGTASESDVYVKGIVSEVTAAYSSQYKNVTFNLSDDGLTTSDQFVAYREKSSYSSTVAAGDAVLVKGKIIYFSSKTPEFQADNAIQTLLAKPVISGVENFTASSSVTISAADGATIYYTTDGTEPSVSSSVYSAAFDVSETTIVKAIASKDGLVTGVASKTFTKVQAYAVTFGAPDNGTITVKHGETTLKTGDEVAAGETITITATPSNGYVLSSLVYNDGTDHDIKSTKTFTMPASAVNITAKFEESDGGTYSMTPDQLSTGSTATFYITTLTEFTFNEISWKMNQWNPSSLQIKTNQSSATSEFRFYNTSAFPGRIKKVVITFSALSVSDASKLMFLGGTSEVTATAGGTAGTWDSTSKTLTWTPGASDNFTYFAFYQNGKAANGTNKLATSDAIVVEYE